jgi:hypothetical protein
MQQYMQLPTNHCLASNTMRRPKPLQSESCCGSPESADDFRWRVQQLPVLGLRLIPRQTWLGVPRKMFEHIADSTMNADLQLEGTQNGRKRPHASTVEPHSETPSLDQESRPTESGKRRRRKLSCETCQRLKCRCDFDPVTRTCHRCKTLRHASVHLPIKSHGTVLGAPTSALQLTMRLD